MTIAIKPRIGRPLRFPTSPPAALQACTVLVIALALALSTAPESAHAEAVPPAELDSPGVNAATDRVAALGPAPRTPSGRFTNTIGELPHGELGVRLPFFLRRIAGSFRDRPDIPRRIENAAPLANALASSGQPTVTWIGHATVLVQMEGVRFLTDPIWSDSPSPVQSLGPRRFVAPGLDLEDLPPIDFVVISHNHYDHLDLPTLRALARLRPETRFIVPVGNGALLRGEGIPRVIELDWGETHRHGPVEIHCLPAQHWSKRGLRDDNKSLWASWAVVGKTRRFYFAGDTGYFDGFARIRDALGDFDLAAIPVGAYEPVAMMQPSHLNPEEAVQAAEEIGAQRALAIHFGTFDLSDEELADPPRRFLTRAAESVLGRAGAWVFAIGESRPF